MTNDKKDTFRTLIELAENVDEADKLIEEFTVWRTDYSKLAFLDGMFDVSVVGHDYRVSDYQIILHALVNAKWR